MPFFKYVLVAILGSAGAATPGATPGSAPATLPRTIPADAVSQPSGGTAELSGQATGGSTDKQAGTGRKGRSHLARRHHRKGHKHDKVITGNKAPKKI